jgi:hypothetical protein
MNQYSFDNYNDLKTDVPFVFFGLVRQVECILGGITEAEFRIMRDVYFESDSASLDYDLRYMIKYVCESRDYTEEEIEDYIYDIY